VPPVKVPKFLSPSPAVRIGQRGREEFQILKDGDRLQADSHAMHSRILQMPAVMMG